MAQQKYLLASIWDQYVAENLSDEDTKIDPKDTDMNLDLASQPEIMIDFQDYLLTQFGAKDLPEIGIKDNVDLFKYLAYQLTVRYDKDIQNELKEEN